VEADFQNASPLPYVVALVMAVLLNITLAWLIARLDMKSAAGGVKLSLLLWFVLVFHNIALHYAFALVPVPLIFIDAGQALATMLVSGAVLGAWQPKGKQNPAIAAAA
jgi:hypothetical protein